MVINPIIVGEVDTQPIAENFGMEHKSVDHSVVGGLLALCTKTFLSLISLTWSLSSRCSRLSSSDSQSLNSLTLNRPPPQSAHQPSPLSTNTTAPPMILLDDIPENPCHYSIIPAVNSLLFDNTSAVVTTITPSLSSRTLLPASIPLKFR
ncbi:hypothetical protein D8674_012199 [Pyrus ussuriensis x Pyrus communis]|uniref:Uncharacterized protein n=1 Tax=Pyrus ussuriensis x Pyrus communis TaxID=2448454 RepID=A0A5N5G5I1_9ROSA|nr:hypothetical protein D8674_012199 [Pyrus ussuriensis x Pyrus communis]